MKSDFEQVLDDLIGIMNPIQNDKEWVDKICTHPEHNFPGMIYILPGDSYTHVCPQCKHSSTMIGHKVIC